jgi:hypothetical protein
MSFVLTHSWKSRTAFINTSLSRYKSAILHSDSAFVYPRERPWRHIGFTPINIFPWAKIITARSSKNLITFHDGDRVLLDIDGSRYEGSIQGKKGGWYSVLVRNEQGNMSIVKKRASQITLISTNDSDFFTTQQSSEQSNDGKAVNDVRYSIREASSIPELIDQTLDSTTIINIDLLLRCRENEQDVIRNKKQLQYLEQCEYFSKTKRWVTFTDLHVAPNTLRTCLDVLSIVHTEAKRQGAGVSFIWYLFVLNIFLVMLLTFTSPLNDFDIGLEGVISWRFLASSWDRQSGLSKCCVKCS